TGTNSDLALYRIIAIETPPVSGLLQRYVLSGNWEACSPCTQPVGQGEHSLAGSQLDGCAQRRKLLAADSETRSRSTGYISHPPCTWPAVTSRDGCSGRDSEGDSTAWHTS